MSASTAQTSLRALVVPQHLHFFDHVAGLVREAAMGTITLEQVAVRIVFSVLESVALRPPGPIAADRPPPIIPTPPS
jgi:hypothetical protein